MATAKTCIYPGCERPAVPPHPLGGPRPSFCELEEHTALTAHLERKRLQGEGAEDREATGGATRGATGADREATQQSRPSQGG